MEHFDLIPNSARFLQGGQPSMDSELQWWANLASGEAL